MRTSLVCLFKHLSKTRRWQLVGLGGLTLLTAMAEMATLGAVIPFLGVLSSAESASRQILGFGCAFTMVEASVFMATIAVLTTALRILLLRQSNRLTFAIGADIGNEVYRRVLYQPYHYHTSHNTSEVIAGVNKANQLVQQVINPFMQGLTSLILAAGIFVALLTIDAGLAVAAMGIFLAMYIVASVVTRRILAKNSKIISENEGKRIQAIQEGLGAIRDVLLDGHQDIYVDRFSRLNLAQRNAQATNSFIRGLPRFVIEGIGVLLMISIAGWLRQRGDLSQTIPILGALALGAQRLLPQLQQAYAAWAAIRGNRAVLLHVLKLLENQIPIEYLQPSDKHAASISAAPKTPIISVRNLSFRYGSIGRPVLKNVCLDIYAGSRIGFIGKTGSGKSTLIDLIMGLLEPTEGAIAINGVPLTAANRRAWQARIAHVPQAIYLSDATIAANIAFGVDEKDIDMERVKACAHQAQIADYIETLPDGYQTPVGERGVRLSGGQRQRIGLARAFYKQVDILVLDEATSALDDATEAAVMNAIDSLERSITVLSIAHRLSTLRRCDRIYELHQGQIVRSLDYADISTLG